jgi:hypothetical protein
MPENKVDKISRILVQVNNQLIVKIHCRLTKEINGMVKNFHNFFSYGDSTYLTLDQFVYMTIEIKQELTAWNKDQTIMITSRNIHQLLQGLKLMIGICKGNANIYYYTTQSNGEDKITVRDNVIKEHNIQLRLLGDDMPRILLHPSAKEDNYGTYYEAIRLYLNRTTIFTDITLDEAESLYYNLSKVDFFQYGMSMIQYYISSIESDKVQFTEEKKQIKKPRVVFNDKKTESVKSTITKEPSAEEFFGM